MLNCERTSTNASFYGRFAHKRAQKMANGNKMKSHETYMLREEKNKIKLKCMHELDVSKMEIAWSKWRESMAREDDIFYLLFN